MTQQLQAVGKIFYDIVVKESILSKLPNVSEKVKYFSTMFVDILHSIAIECQFQLKETVGLHCRTKRGEEERPA